MSLHHLWPAWRKDSELRAGPSEVRLISVAIVDNPQRLILYQLQIYQTVANNAQQPIQHSSINPELRQQTSIISHYWRQYQKLQTAITVIFIGCDIVVKKGKKRTPLLFRIKLHLLNTHIIQICSFVCRPSTE